MVARVERVAAQILEQRSVKHVAAGLGDHAHLAAGAGAELRGVPARLDAELLHVLEAGLQFERRLVLAVRIAGRGVDDGRPFDAVVLDDVLFVGATREAHILPRAIARILRTGRLQHELRHLAAVDRQTLDLALADIGADARRADIQHGRGGNDGDALLHTSGAELEVERQFLADSQRHAGVFDVREAGLLGADRVGGRLQCRNDELA